MSGTYTSFNAILNQLFNNVTLTQPSNYYLGLSSTTPTITGTGDTEPSGLGYARVALSSSTGFTTSTLGTLTNNVTATFPESTGSWGTLTHLILYSASSGGSIWFFEALSPSITVESNTTVYFSNSPAGITVSMTNS